MTNQTASRPIRVGFVLHVMQVAGAEMLVADTIRRLGRQIEPTIFCLEEIGRLGEDLQRNGVRVLAYGRRAGLDLRLPKRMARDIRAYSIEVMHAHQYTPFFYSALAARLVHPRPHIIFTEHGRHYPDITSWKRRLANRLFFNRMADHINAVCQFSADSLARKDGFSSSRISVIPNGIEPARYEATESVSQMRLTLGLRPDRRYVACVARFHPVKDHATLVRAFARVAQANPNVDLLLVGDGPLRQDIQQLADNLGIRERISFLGVRADVPQILRCIDVFTLTSVSEAASITLLEAMAAKRPVVVTAVGGNPEIVRHGVDGLLVPRGDDQALATALMTLLDDGSLAGRLGASAEARVREHFLLEQTIAAYHRLYQLSSRSQSHLPAA